MGGALGRREKMSNARSPRGVCSTTIGTRAIGDLLLISAPPDDAASPPRRPAAVTINLVLASDGGAPPPRRPAARTTTTLLPSRWRAAAPEACERAVPSARHS